MDRDRLHDGVGRLTYAKMEYLAALWEKEREDHRLTIAILKAIVKGDLPISRLEVSDNGWKVLPPDGEMESDDG